MNVAGHGIVAARHLSKHYQTPRGLLKAVDNVSLTIDSQEFVAIMGPSGSGKSTLLSMLGGLVRPSGGQVLLDGTDISSLSDSAITEVRRSQLGFIFQAYHLLEHMTAVENVLFPLQFSDLTRNEQRERARELLKLVGLSERIEHFPRQLSGGEKQRVAIARALANEPTVLLADEPTGNLDSVATGIILEMLQGLNEQMGQTIIMVTHDQAASKYTSRRLVIGGGRLVLNGIAEDSGGLR